MMTQEEMAKFRDLEYCKVDLIASKGIVFCKYAKTSSALLALEAIMANDNMVSELPAHIHMCMGFAPLTLQHTLCMCAVLSCHWLQEGSSTLRHERYGLMHNRLQATR